MGTGTSTWWPGRITRREHHHGALDQQGPQRPSWCYGTPGIARAHQLAALALHDHQRQHQAENALTGCITDAGQLAHLPDATVEQALRAVPRHEFVPAAPWPTPTPTPPSSPSTPPTAPR